jgi:hypothetical protein
VVTKPHQRKGNLYQRKQSPDRMLLNNCMLYTNQRRNEMAKRKGLTDQKDRDEMVVLLEGMPEEDIDATLSETDDSLTITEAMSSASPMGGSSDVYVEEIQGMVDNWDPKTAEGKKYHDELKKAHTKEMKKQGYNDKEDESLGMRTGAEDTKSQSEKSRRDESYGDYGTRT